MWGGLEGRGAGGGGTEDGIELGAEACVRASVRVQEVEGVGDGGGGRVVAGEDEGFDLVDGCLAEGGVHCFGVGGFFGRGGVLEFLFVRVQSEGHDRAVAGSFEGGFGVTVGMAVGVTVGLGGRGVSGGEALVKFFTDETVELTPVQP